MSASKDGERVKCKSGGKQKGDRILEERYKLEMDEMFMTCIDTQAGRWQLAGDLG